MGFTDHSCDEIDVELRKAERAGELIGAPDLLGSVSSSVDFQDVVIEVFDSQAKPGNTQIVDDLQLALREGARFTLEGNFLCLLPGKDCAQPLGQRAQLTGGEIGGSTSPEVDKVQIPVPDERPRCIQLQLLDQNI